MYAKFLKRLFDIIITAPALLILSPVLGITAVLVRIKLGRPVIFRQKRPGHHEKVFRMYKFRTMTDSTDASGNPLPDSMRLTKFGQFLRSTSLDELPELWNILKGDMSLVGPRPLLTDYLPLYNSRQRCRHNVRPGLTGLAQVMGRNSISWEEKFEYDIEYVEHISFLLDLKILLRTVVNVFKREGINSKENIPMEPFSGNTTEDGKGK